MTKSELLKQFKQEVEEVIKLLKKDDVPGARKRFNDIVVAQYEKGIHVDAVLLPFLPFFADLDKFFNNETYRKAFPNYSNRRNMISTYQTEFLEDYKDQLSKIKREG